MMTTRCFAVALSLCLWATACKSGRSQHQAQSKAPSHDQTTSKTGRALDDPDNLFVRPESAPPPSDAHRGGVLRRRLHGTLRGFDWISRHAARPELHTYVHASFGTRSTQHPERWAPDLAYKVTANRDFSEYTIHIREDVQWQTPPLEESDSPRRDWVPDNHTVDAEDCKLFFEMLPYASRPLSRHLERVEIIDDHTFKVTWKEASYQLLRATMNAYPLPKHLFSRTKSGEKIPESRLGAQLNDHWLTEMPVGIGPYKVTVYDRDGRVVLERFDDYFGSAPPIERIEYTSVREHQSYRLLRDGELDFASIGSDSYKSQILDGSADSPFENGTLRHRVVDQPVYSYIGWNLQKPMFANYLTRRALTHALDRNRIIQDIYYGLGQIQTGPFAPDHPANSPDVEPYAYSLEKARRLLSQAGWEDNDNDGIREKNLDGDSTEFQFTLLTYNEPTRRTAMEMYKSDLRDIGVDMQVEPLGWMTMRRRIVEGRFDGYTGEQAGSRTIAPFRIWHSSQTNLSVGKNKTDFRNERADHLIEELRATYDARKRIELARKFHELIHDQQPQTFVRAHQRVYAWNSRVRQVRFRPFRPQAYSGRWHLEDSR
jgi:peptide/nickel transport system substrate-binding protein